MWQRGKDLSQSVYLRLGQHLKRMHKLQSKQSMSVQ